MTLIKNSNPPVAICYDFDGTLAPGNMQDRRFIPDIGLTKDEFWKEVAENTRRTECDSTIGYMYVMLEKAREAGVAVRRQDMAKWGQDTDFFPGVADWFSRINHYGQQQGIEVLHYVISAGNAEIIEASAIAKHLDGVFASRFLYDAQGHACWPAVAINFTTKTQYLFRINKGAFEHDYRDTINKYVPDQERPIPFENIIYLGDGETDVPCFRTVKSLGGLSVAVYDAGDFEKAETFLKEGRVNATAPADYRKGQKLDTIIEGTIDLAAARRKQRANG